MIGNSVSIKQLEALIWVVELGTFRAAAAHLGTTQPNISARIAGLEAALGHTLLLRDAGSVRLTEPGEAILSAARRVLREAEGLLAAAERPDLVTERLRLGVTELVAHTWLHPFLRRLKETFPALSVDLRVDLSATLDQDLAARRLDLALQTAPFQTATSGDVQLGDYPYAWLATPATRQDIGSGATLTELFHAGVLTHARHTQAFQSLEQAAFERRLDQSRITSSSSILSALRMALDGMGVALLPMALARQDLAAGRLEIIDTDWLPAPLSFHARYAADRCPAYVEEATRIAQYVAAEDHELQSDL